MPDYFDLAQALIMAHSAEREPDADGKAIVNADTLADAFASKLEELVGVLRAVNDSGVALPADLTERVAVAIVNAEAAP